MKKFVVALGTLVAIGVSVAVLAVLHKAEPDASAATPAAHAAPPGAAGVAAAPVASADPAHPPTSPQCLKACVAAFDTGKLNGAGARDCSMACAPTPAPER